MIEHLLDTNLFLYAFDPRDPRKQAMARRRIQGSIEAGSGCVSWQVVQEFASAALHKNQLAVRPEELQEYLEGVLFPLCQIYPTVAIWRRALQVQAETQYRFYDSLLVAAAWEAGLREIYSEDMQDGRQIGPVRVVNPFREMP